MAIVPGQTVFIPGPPKQDLHLWVILTPPKGTPPRVLVANITTARTGSDTTCVLVPGDHRFIKTRSVVYYSKAILASPQNLEGAMRTWGKSYPCSPALLKRIQDGLRGSPHTLPAHRAFFLGIEQE